MSDVQTSLTKETSPKCNSIEKTFDCIPEEGVRERRIKKKADICVLDIVIKVDDLTSVEEPITKNLDPGISKRLQRRK